MVGNAKFLVSQIVFYVHRARRKKKKKRGHLVFFVLNKKAFGDKRKTENWHLNDKSTKIYNFPIVGKKALFNSQMQYFRQCL